MQINKQNEIEVQEIIKYRVIKKKYLFGLITVSNNYFLERIGYKMYVEINLNEPLKEIIIINKKDNTETTIKV